MVFLVGLGEQITKLFEFFKSVKGLRTYGRFTFEKISRLLDNKAKHNQSVFNCFSIISQFFIYIFQTSQSIFVWKYPIHIQHICTFKPYFTLHYTDNSH